MLNFRDKSLRMGDLSLFRAIKLKMKKYLFGLMGSAFCSVSLLAQDVQNDSIKLEEVVVSDSRFALKRENSGKTVIKITAEELERSQGQTVAEIIGRQTGIIVNGSRSNAGQNISVFARGGNNRQVLVIIDGIQVSDPSNVNAEYDLRLLNTSQIENIEIVKGAASTLYGNAAATTVINITTKQATSDGVSLNIESSLGTNQSEEDQDFNTISDYANAVTFQAKKDKLSLLVSGGQQFTDGLSAAIGEESDAFSRIDGLFKIGYAFSDRLTINASATYNKLDSDFDNGFPVEDADFTFDGEQSRFTLSSKYSYKNGSINFNGAFNQITRSFQSNFPSAFDSESLIFDVFNKYTFNNKFYTILGVNIIDNKTLFSSEQDATTVDPYANAVYVSDFGLNVNAGLRLNNHSEYGTNLIYNFNPSYVIKTKEGYLKFLGSYATSFIAPNLSQLFGPFGPNTELEPEENTTIEAGVEYKLSNSIRISALYFDRNERDRIIFFFDNATFESQFRNQDEEANFNGFELELEAKPLKGLNITANYTFIDNDTELAARIPKSSVNGLLGYSFSTKTYASLSYQFNADRQDVFFDPITFASTPVTLDSYSVLDLYVKHRITDKLSAFASLNNIFNEEYQEVLNFTTRGRNARFGISLTL